jgi:tetratricopeptide (TPR) repeat protein
MAQGSRLRPRRPWRRASARLAGALRAKAARLALAAFSLWLLLLHAAPASAGSLPYAPALARCYQAILDARFDDAEVEIGRACGPAPKEACSLMRATSVWWRIQIDPRDTSRDAAFRSQTDAVIAAAEAWAAREPTRADAWFFVGASYGLRVPFRALRGERLAAARDAKQVKDALERALALDPSLQDAYFGIGLYRYYADVVPAALKFLRWMLLMPGGNKVEGLQQMQRARERGELLRGEADFQLAWIYLWYEQRTDDALTLLDGLRTTYPHNPLFVQSIAEVQDVYRHDDAASLEAWRTLLALARDRKVALPAASETRARLGIALRLDGFAETDAAIEQLQAIVDARPVAPYGATALARYRLGAAFDRMGWRDRAVAAYKAAVASAPADDPDGVRARARDAMARGPDPKAAEAYRLSLEGYRQLLRKDLAQAGESLSRSAALNPVDPLTTYRQALLLAARGRQADALAAFERVIALRPMPPAFVVAASAFEAGRLLEAAGNRARAVEQYTRAARVRGADGTTRQAAAQALERLRVPQSSR